LSAIDDSSPMSAIAVHEGNSVDGRIIPECIQKIQR
jgi:hypothetical protein